MSEPARELLLCAAAFLDQGRTVDRLSRPLTALALIAFLIAPAIMKQPPWVLIGSAILVTLAGLVETYFAIRVGFDAALFRQLASASEAPDFAGIDAALTRLGLLRATQLDRPAEARVAGAKRLLRFQACALVGQTLCVTVGACIAWIWQ
jgi:hypothetical protein